jgi:exopolyphosphatase / guanosine-5'-triphosphate,3'-diphosphate pyrophosphatase
MNERIGLIDIGSNTIRLVVFQIESNLIMTELQNIKVSARLSGYLNADGDLAKEGIEKLVRIVDAFKKESDYFGVSRLLPMATAAIRQSGNREAIIEEVEKRTGVRIHIVSGEMEAYYGYLAIASSMQIGEAVTADMGGGSTEVTYFKEKEIQESFSLPFGAVTLKQRFFNGKIHSDEEAIRQAADYIKGQFRSLGWLEGRRVPIIAIGGSARNIFHVHRRKTGYRINGIHDYRIDRNELDKIYRLFRKSSREELLNLDGLSSDRADLILPAALAFKLLTEIAEAPDFRFSSRGLREGVMLGELNEGRTVSQVADEMADQSIRHLCSKYSTDLEASFRHGAVSSMLYEEFVREGFLADHPHWRRMVSYGSLLYQAGASIDPDGAAHHSFYLLTNKNIAGLSHKDRVTLALLASYKNKALFRQYMDPFRDWFTDEETRTIQQLGGLIKFAGTLTNMHGMKLHSISLQREGNGQLELELSGSGDCLIQRDHAGSQKKHLERIAGGDVRLKFTIS